MCGVQRSLSKIVHAEEGEPGNEVMYIVYMEKHVYSVLAKKTD